MSTTKILTVDGFKVKKYLSLEGKDEDDSGKIVLTLEAKKEDVKVIGAGYLTPGDFLSALHSHQSIPETVGIQVRFEVDEDKVEDDV